MDGTAVDQAKRHLSRAGRARQALSIAKTIEETRSAWSDFLNAVAAIYEILKVGSGKYGSSAGWYGRVIKERKQDELLRYLHHARNSDYHGLEEVTGDKGLRVLRLMPDGTYAGAMTTDSGDGDLSSFRSGVINPDGTQTIITTPIIQTKFATLVAVTDELHGDRFEVPTRHWGEDYNFHEPINAAATATPYLEALVCVADELSLAKLGRVEVRGIRQTIKAR